MTRKSRTSTKNQIPGSTAFQVPGKSNGRPEEGPILRNKDTEDSLAWRIRKEYSIDNLWKYDLPNGWRLIYTISKDEIRILAILLEWFDHKNYERRFGYKKH